MSDANEADLLRVDAIHRDGVTAHQAILALAELVVIAVTEARIWDGRGIAEEARQAEINELRRTLESIDLEYLATRLDGEASRLIERRGLKPQLSNATPEAPTKSEGAVSQGMFVYNGTKTDGIEPAPWRLLQFMEGKNESDIDEAYHYAINDDEKDWTDSAIKSIVRKANAALEAVSHPSGLSKPRNVSKIVWT